MSFRAIVIYGPVLLVCSLVLLSIADSDERSVYLASSTKRMAERLEKVIFSTRFEASPYMNREKAAHFRSLLGSPLDVRTELKVRIRLAEELLLAGETAESIAELDQIRVFAEGSGAQLTPVFERQLRDLKTLAFLRLGEQENCILHQGVESCLMPIRNSGVHQRKRGSLEAIKGLTEALKETPSDLLARWLLNIAYMTIGEHPRSVPPQWLISAESFQSEYDIGRFPDVAADLGVNVPGLAGGSVIEDFDGDGFLDLMVSSSGLKDQLRYFRNNGDGTFTERTSEAGLLGLTGGLNLVHADYNNDGYRDLFVLRGAWMGSEGHYPNSLLRNNGNGTFDDMTEQAGVLSFHPTQTAAWGDFDSDGWIDLFVGNESKGSESHPSELYRNNGDGTFTNVAARFGVANLGYVKGVAWGDLDNDGRLDLYVSRLGATNLLLRNTGDGLTDVTQRAGVAEPIHSFATWFWDYDNDGWQDIFVSAFHTEKLGDIAAVHLGLPSSAERPRLFRNNGDRTFSDVTKAMGLDRVLLTMGANFGDLDNDGFLDCYFGTGEPDLRALLPNRMFRNAEGRGFQDVTTSGGFGHLQKGHAISFGDLDNDGDQDVYAVMGGAFPGDAFRNVLFANPGHGNNWVTLDLVGTRSNRDAIGARVKIRVSTRQGTRTVHQTVSAGGSFGASSLRVETGLGAAGMIEEIEIKWPDADHVQRFTNLSINRTYRIREGEPKAMLVERRKYNLKAQ